MYVIPVSFIIVSSEIIMQRPDYMKAEKMVEKAGIDVKVARKECLPAINLGGLILFSAQNIGSLFTTSNALWGIGGGLLHPIFAGGRIKANLKAKKIAFIQNALYAGYGSEFINACIEASSDGLVTHQLNINHQDEDGDTDSEVYYYEYE